jgi:thiol:disulfide interchange protein DsbD
MALTYTVAGVVAGLTGANLQAAFQNAWVIGTFSFIFVLLALSMFGFYNLQIPTALQTRLSMLSNQQKGGTLLGAGIMGFFSALIVGPCVAAPLAAALIYIAQTKDAWLGGAALLSLSLGMGAPLLIIGTSAGKLLPRVGDWMNAVKAVFGVLLLGVAVWMLERIMPIQFILLLWSILAITSAAYLGALRRLDNNATGWQKLWQGLGVVLLIYGAILLVSAASGGRDILAPLEHLSAARAATTSNGATAQPAGLAFKRIKGLDGLNAELKAASARGQYVMLDFYADWCVSCKELEHYTFNDAGVKNALSNVLLLQADVTADDAQDQALRQHFGVFGPPAILFFDPAGAEREEFRIIGLMKPEQFIPQARLALGARTQGI